MSEIDIDSAAEALSSELPDSLNEEALIDSDEAIVEDNPTDVEPFTGFNPNDLPEDMQTVYKSMQADYTRKTQELAELRTKFGAFGEVEVDPEEAVRMVRFVQQLDSDPAFAKEFVSHVSNQLGIDDHNQTPVMAEPIVSEDYGTLPDAVVRELEEMREFRHQMTEQQELQALEAELTVQEQTIRTSNPNFTDDDMDAVYTLAHATNGDLFAAADQYHAIQQRLLGNYLQSKQVPHGATRAPGGPSNIPSKDFGSNLDAAHKAAMEALRNIS
jgi:hypothetical protein